MTVYQFGEKIMRPNNLLTVFSQLQTGYQYITVNYKHSKHTHTIHPTLQNEVSLIYCDQLCGAFENSLFQAPTVPDFIMLTS